jgi:ribosomal-protein-alanine N-acetyltransferase
VSIPFSKTFPVFHLNEQFYLREHEEQDVQSFYDYYTPEVSQYILAPKPKDFNDAKSEIQYCKNLFHFKRGVYWSIAEINTHKMIGAIGLTIHALNKRAEIHYDLCKSYWGKGLTTQAISQILHYAFDTLGLIRVEAITMRENMPSQKVLIKNNFLYEGCLHAYKYYEGKAVDIEMFAITHSHYKATHGNT